MKKFILITLLFIGSKPALAQEEIDFTRMQVQKYVPNVEAKDDSIPTTPDSGRSKGESAGIRRVIWIAITGVGKLVSFTDRLVELKDEQTD